VQRAVVRAVRRALDDDLAVLAAYRDVLMQRARELALGPFTRTVFSSITISTPAGIEIGFLPILDIFAFLPLPDEREELAASLGGARVTVGHHALRRGEDRHAQPIADARDLVALDVPAQSRLRDARQLADHRLVLVVLQVDAQDAVLLVVQQLEVVDVVVLLEKPRDLDLQLLTGMSTLRRRAPPALRMRVNMSAIGSVIMLDRSYSIRPAAGLVGSDEVQE
jgi:hypothetical protein